MNKIKFNFSLIFDLVKSCDLMIPFVSRSSIMSEVYAESINHPDIPGMLTINQFYGFTGLHAIKEQSLLYPRQINPYELYRWIDTS